MDPNQEESGNQAIHLLLTHPVVGPQTDFVATYRDNAYEVWAQRGMVRFQRLYDADGGYDYRVVETLGRNPIEQQDHSAVATIDEELEAARRSGNHAGGPGDAFMEPESLTYPLAYERIAQLFDSPNAPDLVVNPKCYAYGHQPGQHGTLDVVQSRALLVFSGPGIVPGVSEDPARQIDIAPTIARLMDFPRIDGRDAVGRPSSDVFLRRQDGRPMEDILDLDGNGEPCARPERVYLFLLDGLSHSELQWRLEHDHGSIPYMRRVIERGRLFRYGSISSFPSITWPCHNTIGTGCWSGHHDIVNPAYYLRETRQLVTPQDDEFDTAKFLGDEMETLFEAFHRVYGAWEGDAGALTAAINEPCTRGADHSVLEHSVLGDRDLLRSLTRESQGDTVPRWLADDQENLHKTSIIDNAGLGQARTLFSEDSHPPPIFTFHEIVITDSVGHDYGPHDAGLRDALDETDLRFGRLVRTLEERGLFDSTLFIIAADHGMAPTRAELKANQVGLLPREGMKAVVPSPFVYLLDMAVEVARAPDGRSATVTVLVNDADGSGERPPVAGAEIVVSNHDGAALTRATTDGSGTAVLPLPGDGASDDTTFAIQHQDYNTRRLRPDGSSVAPDLRELLYGDSKAGRR